jgi:hypothetical protein
VNAPAVPASIGLGLGLGAVALVAVGGLAFVLWKNKERFDITSSKNLAYTGASSVVEALTGEKGATVGTKAYDWITGGNDYGITAPVALDHAALQLRAGSRTYREGAAPPPVW